MLLLFEVFKMYRVKKNKFDVNFPITEFLFLLFRCTYLKFILKVDHGFILVVNKILILGIPTRKNHKDLNKETLVANPIHRSRIIVFKIRNNSGIVDWIPHM